MHLTRDLTVLLFATVAGLTLSGIVANIYRLVARKPENRSGKIAYFAVMVLAGPSVLFENATRSWLAKNCSRVAYGFAIAIAGYWAFMIGLFILDLSHAL